MTRITVSMPEPLVRSLEAEARLRRMSLSELIRVRLNESERPFPGFGFAALGASNNGTACKSAEELLEETWADELSQQ